MGTPIEWGQSINEVGIQTVQDNIGEEDEAFTFTLGDAKCYCNITNQIFLKDDLLDLSVNTTIWPPETKQQLMRTCSPKSIMAGVNFDNSPEVPIDRNQFVEKGPH